MESQYNSKERKTMYCKHCLKFIYEGDPEICPYCGKPQKKKEIPNVLKKWWIWLIVALLIFIIAMPNASGPNRAECIVMAQDFVTSALKSPSTAKFGAVNDFIVKVSDDIVMVEGYVDSQNGFGAMIHTNFLVQMQAGESNYRLLYMEIDDESIGEYIHASFNILK